MSSSYENSKPKLKRMDERDYFALRKTVGGNIDALKDGVYSWIFDESSDLRAILQDLLSESLDTKTKPIVQRHLKELDGIEKNDAPKMKKKLTKCAKDIKKRSTPFKTEFAVVYSRYSDAITATMTIVTKLEIIRTSALGMVFAEKDIPNEFSDNPSPIVTPATTPANFQKICGKCGTENDALAGFCDKCGATLT